MKSIPQISDAEWQIMKVLWAGSPATANQVIDALQVSTSWKPKTVKSMISRLVAKKAVGFEKDSKSYLYYPLVSEAECIKAESESFVRRVYDGAFNVMLASFIKESKLSAGDIEELKRILDDKQEK